MSSADDTATADADAAAEDGDAAPVDEAREALLASFSAELGDAIVGSHITVGHELWIRIAHDAWSEAGRVVRRELGFDFFDFLSAIDWLPSPYGRDMDAEQDGIDAREAPPMETGVAGGDSRFQVFARVASTTGNLSVILKVDVPDDDLAVATWVPHYVGADWHEREAWEMFGIDFIGHPGLRHLYLPGQFEGNPLRKDFPLLARRVKPWPGIVDVEQMPGDDEGPAEGGEDTAEDGSS